ncbi:MAG: transporter substrate-binding domain-containing protein [Rhodospirillales bacterium]|nr:transporter substrate-binding domain-containing protein [Rhodospirillales bacterium]
MVGAIDPWRLPVGKTHPMSLARTMMNDCSARACWLLIACAVITLIGSGNARAEQPDTAEKAFVVGVVNAPPFVMKDPSGHWDGIAVRLWQHIAEENGWSYTMQEKTPGEAFSAAEGGRLGIMLSAVARADMEALVDFSHPYYSAGLSIAVNSSHPSGWYAVLQTLVSWQFVRLIGFLVLVLMAAGFLVWLFEHRRNHEQFSNSPNRGLTDGLWWAAVTMTTVGYGDKAPKTHLGRLVGGIWMFIAVVLISLFTAQVASLLTAARVAGHITGPQDLVKVRTGALEGSATQQRLRQEMGVWALGYPSFVAGLDAVAGQKIDAFVAGKPILRYEVASRYPGQLQTLDTSFLREDLRHRPASRLTDTQADQRLHSSVHRIQRVAIGTQRVPRRAQLTRVLKSPLARAFNTFWQACHGF